MNMFNVWIGIVSAENGDGPWVFAETSYNRALDRLAQHCRDNWSEFTESFLFDREEEKGVPGHEDRTSSEIVELYYDTITWEHFDISACPITMEMLAAIPGSIVIGDSLLITQTPPK